MREGYKRKKIWEVLKSGPGGWVVWLLDPGMHEWVFRRRRFMNWFFAGLAFAFYYFGRYNLTVAKGALKGMMTMIEFGDIKTAGSWSYALSFLFTGWVADRYGGRIAMLIGSVGVVIANAAMGLVLYGNHHFGWDFSVYHWLMGLFILNMHFQSYGAIAIVSVKAPWFHVDERGQFGTIFGWMISAGVYFAFGWGYSIDAATRATVSGYPGYFGHWMSKVFGFGNNGYDENWWFFFLPALFLAAVVVPLYIWLKDYPSEAGFEDFETGQTSVDDSGRLPVLLDARWSIGRFKFGLPTKESLVYKAFSHPVLKVIIAIEFCSGIIGKGTMNWYYLITKSVGLKKELWVTANWGLSLFIAGVIGATLAGWASDQFFKSKRGPTVALLYGATIAACLGLTLTLVGMPILASVFASFMVMTSFGVHGLLSGTATADFGGKNTGVVTGIVDGTVYFALGFQFLFVSRFIAPEGDAAKDLANWSAWPMFQLVFVVVAAVLATMIWNVKPKSKQVQGEEDEPASLWALLRLKRQRKREALAAKA